VSRRTVEMTLSTSGLDAEGKPTLDPLGIAAPDPPDRLAGKGMMVNIGPQHPATHGVLRLVVELDGETVVRLIPHVGYLHSGFEKLGEYRHYNQIIPLTDRTDYLAPMANNVCFALAVEKLMGIEITERCTVLRVIACEMSRIISHIVWIGTTGIDLGAFTPFLWSFQEREMIYNLQEAWTGARLTTSMTRVGGLMADIPEGWAEELRGFTRNFPKVLDEIDTPLVRMYRQTRAEGFGAEVKRRIMLGTYALSSGYYDEYYGTAQRARSLIAQDFAEVFEQVDMLFTPTAPTPAFALGEHTDDPLAMYLSDVFTVTANLAGIPAMSVPLGEVDGLPVGGQVLAPWWHESEMLAVAGTLEAALGRGRW